MSGEWAVAGYRHIRELGEGAVGRVMLAVRKSTDTPVAIRYLPPRPTADGEAGFRDQARVIAGLDDGGLVRLHEYVESPHGAALVSELVNGISLERIIKAEGRLAPEAALTVCKATLLALETAHRTGLVHGAVSPGNILVDGQGTSRLAGLGVMSCGGNPATAGAARYRAPEVAGGAPMTAAADLYSAAAVLYECLTGEPPSPAGAHRTGLGEVPDPLVPLVADGLAENPTERPGGASAFVGRLETVALAGYGADWEQRGRAQLVERAGVLRLLFPLSRKLVSDDKTRAMFGGAGCRRSRRLLIAALAAALLLVGGTGAMVYASGKPGGETGRALPSDSETGPAAVDGLPEQMGFGPDGFPSATQLLPAPSTSAIPHLGGAATGDPRDRSSTAPASPSSAPSSSPGQTSPPPDVTPFQATAVEIIDLSLDEAGTVATARVKVTGSGSGTATVAVQFYLDGAAHGSAETATVEVAEGEATVEVTHSYESCPGAYAGEATASPGSAPAHRLDAEGECA